MSIVKIMYGADYNDNDVTYNLEQSNRSNTDRYIDIDIAARIHLNSFASTINSEWDSRG